MICVLQKFHVGGEGVTGYEREAKEQREGGNELRTAHAASKQGRTALILRESGRKGDLCGKHQEAEVE